MLAYLQDEPGVVGLHARLFQAPCAIALPYPRRSDASSSFDTAIMEFILGYFCLSPRTTTEGPTHDIRVFHSFWIIPHTVVVVCAEIMFVLVFFLIGQGHGDRNPIYEGDGSATVPEPS